LDKGDRSGVVTFPVGHLLTSKPPRGKERGKGHIFEKDLSWGGIIISGSMGENNHRSLGGGGSEKKRSGDNPRDSGGRPLIRNRGAAKGPLSAPPRKRTRKRRQKETKARSWAGGLPMEKWVNPQKKIRKWTIVSKGVGKKVKEEKTKKKRGEGIRDMPENLLHIVVCMGSTTYGIRKKLKQKGQRYEGFLLDFRGGCRPHPVPLRLNPFFRKKEESQENGDRSRDDKNHGGEADESLKSKRGSPIKMKIGQRGGWKGEKRLLDRVV